MTAHRVGALMVAAAAFWTAGIASHAAQPGADKINECIGVCTKLEERCRFGGTRDPICEAKFRVCADSCARTGRPIH
jgi:hypothetical protein